MFYCLQCKTYSPILINGSETLKGGVGGGVVGLAVGLAGVYAAAARYPAFRHLTLPLKAFIVTSSGTFTGMGFYLLASMKVNPSGKGMPMETGFL